MKYVALMSMVTLSVSVAFAQPSTLTERTYKCFDDSDIDVIVSAMMEEAADTTPVVQAYALHEMVDSVIQPEERKMIETYDKVLTGPRKLGLEKRAVEKLVSFGATIGATNCDEASQSRGSAISWSCSSPASDVVKSVSIGLNGGNGFNSASVKKETTLNLTQGAKVRFAVTATRSIRYGRVDTTTIPFSLELTEMWPRSGRQHYGLSEMRVTSPDYGKILGAVVKMQNSCLEP